MQQGNGYTILEVMIFLAISGFMLIAAVVAIGGRQQEVQFSQAARDFENKINDLISDVEVGYFQRDAGFGCDAVGAVDPEPVISYATGTTGNVQGETGECALIGKTIVMSDEGRISSNNNDVINDKGVLRIFDMASVRLNGDENPANSIDEAKPTPLVTSSPHSPVATYRLRYGLEVDKVIANDTLAPAKHSAAGALAIINTASAGSAADLATGAEATPGSTSAKVVTAVFTSVSADQGINNFATYWRTVNDGQSPDYTQVVICLSGPNARNAAGVVDWSHRETASLLVSSGGTTELVFDGTEDVCGP